MHICLGVFFFKTTPPRFLKQPHPSLLFASRLLDLVHAQASVFVYLGDQMRLIVAGQVPTATADRELFFQDVSLLLQALLGLAVGEEQVRWAQIRLG